MSILGRAADVGAYGPGTHAQLKVPFALYASELPPFLGPTTRVAGLGPWFGGCFLLALVLTVLLLARRTDRSSAPIITALFVVGVLLGTVIVMPETWWARYAPQLWLVPLLVGAAGVLWSSGAVRRWMGASVLALLLLNAMAVGAVNLAGQAYARERINQTFDSLGSSRHPVPIKQGDFMQSWVKFSERGIAYTIVPDSAKLAGGVAFPYLTVVAFPR
jgi:hypothetical protein